MSETDRQPRPMGMSLKHFVELPEVRDLLDEIMPPFDRIVEAPLLVPSRSPNPALVGTAFDYAVRLLLQRRLPHARVQPWIASSAIDAGGSFGTAAPRIVDAARSFVAATDGAEDFRAAADHSVRLAKLDEYFRAGFADPECERVEPNVRDEVLAMLEHTPFDRFSHPSRIALNPTFGRWSALVGGADADLVRGDLLIDLKTTAKPYLERAYVRQALGYLILARRACARDASLPKPRRVGIYFGRFGYLWVSPRVSEHPRYREVARAFVARAKQPEDQAPPARLEQHGVSSGDRLTTIDGSKRGSVVRGQFLAIQRHRSQGAVLLERAGEQVLVTLGEDYEVTTGRLSMVPTGLDVTIEIRGCGDSYDFSARQARRPRG